MKIKDFDRRLDDLEIICDYRNDLDKYFQLLDALTLGQARNLIRKVLYKDIGIYASEIKNGIVLTIEIEPNEIIEETNEMCFKTIGEMPIYLDLNTLREIEVEQAKRIITHRIAQSNCAMIPTVLGDIDKLGLMIPITVGDLRLMDNRYHILRKACR